MSDSTTPIQFGILTIPYQIIDVAGPLDILSACSTTLFTLSHAPEHLISASIPIEFHHIGVDFSPMPLTANLLVIPTTTLATCPKLDYLLIGGPMPSWPKESMPEAMKEFVRARVGSGELKKVFTNCTGALVLAETGLLDGFAATVNHGTLDIARELWPKVNWVKERWVEEKAGGKTEFWTAGGAFLGIDMMADWVVNNYGGEVAKFGFAMLAYEGKDFEGNVRVL